MSKPTYTVTLRIFIKELIAFFKDNPEYGTAKKPYPADLFYELYAPSSPFYGSLHNILVFQNNSYYKWVLESTDGTTLKFSSTTDDVMMEMEMITGTPPDKNKWKQMFVFTDDPIVEPDGKLKVKNKTTAEDIFILETSGDVTKGGKTKYSFLFEFDDNGITKYGKIDPFTDIIMPPPEFP